MFNSVAENLSVAEQSNFDAQLVKKNRRKEIAFFFKLLTHSNTHSPQYAHKQ